MKELFKEYKPIRNHLNKLSVEDSIYVIWAYSQNLVFGHNIPGDIQTIPEYNNANSWIEKRVFPWELEILIREIIINGLLENVNKKTLKKWSYFSSAINKVKNFQNEISKKYSDQRNILVELFRLSHNQFPWQESIRQQDIIRYYKIFSEENLNNIILRQVGLELKEIYTIGMLFSAAYLSHPAINLPINVELEIVNSKNINIFLNYFCIDIKELKRKLIDEQELNEKFQYSISALRGFPLIKSSYQGEERILCPLPTLLFWRITSAIYYDICLEDDFGNFFGDSFQKYVGEVCSISDKEKKLKVYSEEVYKIGKNKKNTIDWIVEDKNSLLFIECKTKRIKKLAKEEILDEKPLIEELEKMSDFIFQTYKTIFDYKNDLYSNIRYDSKKQVFPIILTLEDWFAFGDYSIDKINEILEKKFRESNIPSSYLIEMPYSIVSITEFEILMQLIQEIGIDELMRNKVFDKEMFKWAMKSYFYSKHNKLVEKTIPLFKEEYEKLFPEMT